MLCKFATKTTTNAWILEEIALESDKICQLSEIGDDFDENIGPKTIVKNQPIISKNYQM